MAELVKSQLLGRLFGEHFGFRDADGNTVTLLY